MLASGPVAAWPRLPDRRRRGCRASARAQRQLRPSAAGWGGTCPYLRISTLVWPDLSPARGELPSSKGIRIDSWFRVAESLRRRGVVAAKAAHLGEREA